jgi:hypothetical protein
MAQPPPPAYGGFVRNDDLEAKAITAHFQQFNERKPINLGNGYIAKPIWQIERERPYTRMEETQANLLNFWWTPKKIDNAYQYYEAQRCPYISVDNLCFLYSREMHDRGAEPHLILGIWEKQVELYGSLTKVKGLVLAAGGHYERMANKSRPEEHAGGRGFKTEGGDSSLRAAADKELNEEIGIDKTKVKVTRELGFMDDCISEPRAHYLRCIFLRWIEQSPRPSEELKTVIPVPLSKLPDLCSGKIAYKDAQGQELRLELGHDRLLHLVMAHPETQGFLANLVTIYDPLRIEKEISMST